MKQTETKEKKQPTQTIVEAAPPNPKLKDAFFHKVFESKERLYRLVEFLQGKPMDSLTIAPVIPILFSSKENDLSFLSNETYYYMLEQQSTSIRICRIGC